MQEKAVVETILEKIADQWKLLAAVLGAALLVLALVAGWSERRARTEREATNLLYEAQSSARKFLAEKKPEDAEKAYAPLLERFKGSRASYEAELQIGDIWMDGGNFDRASAHYASALQMTSDPFSRLLANYNIGVAKETAGKSAEAVSAYEAALGIQGSDFLRPEILMAEARCYEVLNQAKKAIDIYKVVQEKYANRSYYSGAASAFEKQLSARPL
jgi:tetratricopeptide (TPR) repeat protein